MSDSFMVEPSRLQRLVAPPRRIAGTLLRLLRHAGSRQDAREEWRRRFRGEPALPAGPIRNVLVLCHGNICRSPFAAQLLADRHPSLDVKSAGLAAAEGDPAHRLACKLAPRHDVSLDAHRSHRVTESDLAAADLVLVMQGSQAHDVREATPAAASRVRLLGDYLSAAPFLLTDPWGDDESRFVDSFDRIAEAVTRLGLLLDAQPKN